MEVAAVQVWQHAPSYFLAGGGSSDIEAAPGQFGDPSFEQISIASGSTAYHPSSYFWIYDDRSGLASRASGGGTAVPDGSQAAVLARGPDGLGRIAQTIGVPSAGDYVVVFRAARGAGVASLLIVVSVDGKAVGRITPRSTTFRAYATRVFPLGAARIPSPSRRPTEGEAAHP